jgi:hypothetical protein
MENAIMRNAVATSLIVFCVVAAPAAAEQSQLSQIIFGKAYDDDVIAIQVAPIYGKSDGYRRSIRTLNSEIIRNAQAQASRDPSLQHALAIRGIKLHNVLRVETAGNGGKVVYYR